MKYFKYLLVILAVLVIGFLLLGFVKPQIAYDSEILVDKPASESWMVATDEEKLSGWLPGFQKTELVSGTPGTVGAVSNVYFDDGGKPMIMRETITNIVPDESIAMTFENEFMDMDYRMMVTTVNGKTQINSSTIARGNGMISKSIMALFGSSFKVEEDKNLSNLKKTIEENEKIYSPIDEEINVIEEVIE